MGAGRVFEGNAEMMWNSLKKLMACRATPRSTAGTSTPPPTPASRSPSIPTTPPCEPRRGRRAPRANGKPTLPTRLDRELETNPFLRAGNAAIRPNRLPFAPDWKVFAEIRERKNKA